MHVSFIVPQKHDQHQTVTSTRNVHYPSGGRARGADSAIPPPNESAAGDVGGGDEHGPDAGEQTQGALAGPAASFAEGTVVPEFLVGVSYILDREGDRSDVRQSHGL